MDAAFQQDKKVYGSGSIVSVSGGMVSGMLSRMPGARDLDGHPHLAHEYAELLGDGAWFSDFSISVSQGNLT